MIEALGQFHFLRPWWLLALPAAALLLWAVQWRSDVRRRWRRTIAPHLLEALVVQGDRGLRLRPVHLSAALIVLGGLAMAGPTWERERPPFVEDKAPLAIAIDLSSTMDAIDLSPTRLERAKLKVKALLALRPGGRTAVYAYAGSVHLVLPLTDDAQLLQTFVDALQTSIMPVPGKNTALALRTIDASLAKEDTPGTIVFFTDGVEEPAFGAFKAQVDSGRSLPVVLAFGTEQGGPVRSGDGFVQDAGGRQTFARLDVAALKRLKSEADVPMATVTPQSDDDVRWVQHRVQSHLAQKQAQENTRWRDAGWWLCIPIALLGLLAFRKGWTVRWAGAWLLALGAGIGMPGGEGAGHAWAQGTVASKAEAPAGADGAQGAPGRRFVDLWLTRDQQGRRAFERGDFAAAQRLFDDPMWRGVAAYRAGDYAAARESFARVDSPDSEFNQGDALAREGRYEDAQARFGQALKQRPGWPQAQANIKLMQALIAQKKKDDDEKEESPDLKPDKVVFDKKKGEGQRELVRGAEQSAEAWMRNIQTSPTQLLAHKFALQAQQGAEGKAPEGKP